MKNVDENEQLLNNESQSNKRENTSSLHFSEKIKSHCCCKHNNMQESGEFKLSDFNWKDILKLILGFILVWVKNSWRFLGIVFLGIVLLYMIIGGIVTAFILFVAILGKLYYVQDKLLYHPNMPSNSRLFSHTANTFHLSGVADSENVYINTKDGVMINIQILLQSVENLVHCPTIIFFHGNAGNIGHRLPNALTMYTKLRCNIVLVEYRGYGKSSGSPSEYGLYYDAEAALEYIYNHSKLGNTKVILFGRSLGGAVAIYLASNPRFSSRIFAMVVENTFTSLPDIGKQIFNLSIIKYMPNMFFRSQYPSVNRIKQIKMPSLFIGGQEDTLVPPEMMKSLYDLCGSSFKRFAQIEKGTHNDTWMHSGYFEIFSTVLNDIKQYYNNNSNAEPSLIYRIPSQFNGELEEIKIVS